MTKITKTIIAGMSVLAFTAIMVVFIFPIPDTIGYYIVLLCSLYIFVATITLCIFSKKARNIVEWIIELLLRV